VSKQNVEIVRQVFDAFNAGDIDLILAFTHPEFVVEVPPELSAEPDTYRGHDGMRRYWDSFREVMQEIRFQPERLWDAGDDVVVAMRISAKGRRTAIPVEQRTYAVWSLREHRVIRVRVFASLSEALERVQLRN